MGKLKKELFEFDKHSEEVLFYHGIYLEDSIVLNFLNLNFETVGKNEKFRNIFLDLFCYDQLLSHTQILSESDFTRMSDYKEEIEEQILYFHSLQEELKKCFSDIYYQINHANRGRIIQFGPFSSLRDQISELGDLSYSLIFDDLNLIWKEKPTSFRQLLLRSLVSFFKYDKSVLKYVCICLKCEKIYLNKRGNPKFCSSYCGKIFHEKKRNNKERMALETSDDKYARHKRIKRNAEKNQG